MVGRFTSNSSICKMRISTLTFWKTHFALVTRHALQCISSIPHHAI